MKIGDLVRVDRKKVWLSKEEWRITGIITEKLECTRSSGLKAAAYRVLWSAAAAYLHLPVWYSEGGLEIISESR